MQWYGSGKRYVTRGMAPPAAAATASGLLCVSPRPLASVDKQRRGTKRGACVCV